MAGNGHEMIDLAKLKSLDELAEVLAKYGFLSGKSGNLGERKNLGHIAYGNREDAVKPFQRRGIGRIDINFLGPKLCLPGGNLYADT